MSAIQPASMLRQYRNTGLEGVVESASPHELVRLLMDGALTRIASAAGNTRRNEVARKGENISRAISIIEGLRTSLAHDAGGEVAANLEDLYEYMVRQLALANVRNDADGLMEVETLLSGLRDAWFQIGEAEAGAAISRA
jgi:flagellar protein FliS